jgi:hypothetical protein
MTTRMKLQDDEHRMYEPRMDAILNQWYARYDDARASLEEGGGYLLPYKSQFFITQEEGIRELGLDPEDPDWERIGWDWVKPANSDAWQRLKAKRTRARESMV